MNSGVCRNTPIFRILGWLDVERNQIRHESGTRTLTGRSQSDHDPTISGDGTDRNDPHSVHAIDGVRPGSHACSKKPREAVTNDESTIVSRRGSKRAWACARRGTHGDQQAGRAGPRPGQRFNRAAGSRSGRRSLGYRERLILRHRASGFRLRPATGRDDCLGQAPGVSEAASPIDDLGWFMSIDQRFRDDKTRSKCANLRFGRNTHASHIPFMWSDRTRNITSPAMPTNESAWLPWLSRVRELSLHPS